MKRFVFSLEALLEKRKRDEDAVKLEISYKNQEIFNAKKRLYDLKEQLQSMQSVQKKDRSDLLNMVALRHSVSFRNRLKLDMLTIGDQIQQLYSQLSEIRQRLVKAKQKRKAIELIKEKRYSEWQKENRRKEQVFVDDISQQKFTRSRAAIIRQASAA